MNFYHIPEGKKVRYKVVVFYPQMINPDRIFLADAKTAWKTFYKEVEKAEAGSGADGIAIYKEFGDGAKLGSWNG